MPDWPLAEPARGEEIRQRIGTGPQSREIRRLGEATGQGQNGGRGDVRAPWNGQGDGLGDGQGWICEEMSQGYEPSKAEGRGCGAHVEASPPPILDGLEERTGPRRIVPTRSHLIHNTALARQVRLGAVGFAEFFLRFRFWRRR